MTGARVKRIAQYLEGETDFFLTYGDGVGTVDIRALLEFHRTHGRLATVTGVRPPGRFGELGHVDGRVVGFNEKPQASGGQISAGFFVFKREFLDRLDAREDLMLEREPMEELVRDEQLMVYEHSGFWSPMDTYRDFRYLNDLVEKGEAPWVRW
jgi:glucose-1-phosphate cytidylyltransferase